MEPSQRAPAGSFQELIVWQKAHRLVLDIYRMSRSFPREEAYGLTRQMRRAAVSVPANIAEGFRKRGNADKARFFNIAEGPLEEVRYYLILAHDLELADCAGAMERLEEVSRMLKAYGRRILSSDS